MIRIKMKKSVPWSENGLKTQVYEAKQTYEVCDELAKVFIENKWAKDVDEDRQKEIKALGESMVEMVDECLAEGISSEEIAIGLKKLKAFGVSEELFQEYFEKALEVKADGIEKIEDALADRLKAEKDEADAKKTPEDGADDIQTPEDGKGKPKTQDENKSKKAKDKK